MVKQMSIGFKSIRMALLCLAVLFYGAPVAASAASHDKSHMQKQIVLQQVEMTAESHCEDAAQPMDCSQMEEDSRDCCQTDDCERNCASSISMMAVIPDVIMARFETAHYMGYNVSRANPLADNTNPPPIS